MNQFSQTTNWIYMAIILTVLSVIIWNLFQRFAIYSGISRIILTLSLAIMCLLLIGEVSNETFFRDTVNLERQAEMVNLQSKTNPCTPFIMTLTAVLLVLAPIILIVFAEDIFGYVKNFLGLQTKSRKVGDD